MTDLEPVGPSGSRRQLLRWTGLAAGAGLVGAGALAGTAAATYCPRSPGYWATHDWPTDSMSVGGVSFTQSEGQSLLLQPVRGDKAVIMAKHLLATKLNLWRRPVDDPLCSDVPLAQYGGRTVEELKEDANNWLIASAWPDRQVDWTVGGVDGEALKDALADFNNNRIEELSCDCDGEDDGNGPPSGRGSNGKGRGR